ncbi:MAG: type II secretion system F family protein [Pseudomonadota bacterium]
MPDFTYRAVNEKGVEIDDRIAAHDRSAAIRELAQKGLTVLKISNADADDFSARFLRRRPQKSNLAERVLILRQMAVMARAAVDQLEIVKIVGSSAQSVEAREGLASVAARLRRGEPLSEAMRGEAPVFPEYVYALVQVGEASGRLDKVLADAADQLTADQRLQKDIGNALTYPLFLATAGILAVFFLFYAVVPNFADMIEQSQGGEEMTFLTAAVISTGLFLRENIFFVLLGMGGLAAAGVTAWANPRARAGFMSAVGRAPVLSDLFAARERASWSRTMSYALANGVRLLDAMTLAAGGLPEGRFRRLMAASVVDLRAGRKLDEALEEKSALPEVDLGLLRAGQQSGSLDQVLGYIADRYEEETRDTIKRMTALVEPLAIGFVSLLIGVVAIALVTALSSLYGSL